jgi:integrase
VNADEEIRDWIFEGSALELDTKGRLVPRRHRFKRPAGRRLDDAFYARVATAYLGAVAHRAEPGQDAGRGQRYAAGHRQQVDRHGSGARVLAAHHAREGEHMRTRACIVKRDGKWSVKQPLPDGRYRWRTVGTRKKDAERLRDELNRRVTLGAAYREEPQRFEAFADAWLERYRQRVRPSTYELASLARRHLAAFDDRLVEQVTAATAEDEIAALACRSPRMAQVTLRTLKQILRNAQERGQVVDEAVLRLRAPRYDERPPRFLTWAEVEELASWMPESVARIVPFAAASGLRQGECFRLREADVDFDAGTVTVRQSKTRTGVRAVHLPQLALLLLREQLLARSPGTSLVFPAPAGGEFDRNHFMGRYFRPAARRAKLENVDFHALRHTFIALMAKAGVHVSVIAAMVGHTDGGALLLRRYRHLFPDEARDAAAAFDRLVRGGVAQGSQPTPAFGVEQ